MFASLSSPSGAVHVNIEHSYRNVYLQVDNDLFLGGIVGEEASSYELRMATRLT